MEKAKSQGQKETESTKEAAVTVEKHGSSGEPGDVTPATTEETSVTVDKHGHGEPGDVTLATKEKTSVTVDKHGSGEPGDVTLATAGQPEQKHSGTEEVGDKKAQGEDHDACDDVHRNENKDCSMCQTLPNSQCLTHRLTLFHTLAGPEVSPS